MFVAVQARERERLAEAEPVELERERLLRRVVDLVREHEHRLVRLAQDLRELLVARRDAGARVDDEEHEVGLARSPRAPARRSARVIGLGSAMSTPPVSISRKRLPFHSQTSSLRSRVVPCVSCTTAARVAVSRLIERRLADVREADDRDRADRASSARVVGHSGGVTPFGRPCAWTSASQSKSTWMRRSISAVASL